MNKKAQKPNLFEYGNYRKYLNDLYDYLKENKSFFSYRYFSKKAGFRAPNVLKLVIEGKRNIATNSIEKFSTALGLTKKESQFFRTLVLFNQAKSTEEKNLYAEQLIKNREFRKVHPLAKEEYSYYSQWYNIPIKELLSIKEFNNDPKEIAHSLIPQISIPDTKQSIEELEKLGLIEIKNGKIKNKVESVSTGNEVKSSAIFEYHKQMIKKAIESLDLFKGLERDISSITISASEETFKKLKTKIQNFRKELLDLADADKAANRVYQFNFQIFPLSEKIPLGQSTSRQQQPGEKNENKDS